MNQPPLIAGKILDLNAGLLVVAGEDAEEGGNVGEEEGKGEKDIEGEELEREHR
jgi:hypothetical protein